MKELFLGWNKDQEIYLSKKTLQRHFGSFGQCGSGKTVANKVLIEELSRNGIPVIAFDPQGDIASMGLLEDKIVVRNRGVPEHISDSFSENVEVLVWTPGSSKGLPLSINPLQFLGFKELDIEDRIRLITSTASNLLALADYKLSSTEGKSAEAILSVAFEYCVENGIELENIDSLIKLLKDLPSAVVKKVNNIFSAKIMSNLVRKISLLTMGSNKLLFDSGIPADINVLLGLDGYSDNTRISVIYLNTLNNQKEKNFFVNCISQKLYHWMLLNPLENDQQEGIQCAFYIDEIAPYIPPVKKPSCKETLQMLFKQARKYGVACIIAAQNPGDIDYKVVSQISSYNIGNLSSKQDIDYVKQRLRSNELKSAEYMIRKLPSLKSGNFVLRSPEEFDSIQTLRIRWLVTKHNVLTENQLTPLISKEMRNFYLNKEFNDNDTLNIDLNESQYLFGLPFDNTKSSEIVNTRLQQLENPIDEDEQRPIPKNNVQKSSGEEGPVIENCSTHLIKRNNLIKKGTSEFIKVIQTRVYESDIQEVISDYLKGFLFTTENISFIDFTYLPLIKIEISLDVHQGIFGRRITKVKKHIFLNHSTFELMNMFGDRITFDTKPKIESYLRLDGYEEQIFIDSVPVAQLENDIENIELDYSGIYLKKFVERRYGVKVLHNCLVLYPLWKCKVVDRNKEKRTIVLDGVFGKEIVYCDHEAS